MAEGDVASRAVKIKAKDVDAIASRSDVAYMSLDREVKLLGHVSLTTGADAAKAIGGTTKYDGTGIGIAVFDSGIDPNHISLNDATNATRIVKSVDFTGENRTDDPYGHGTHVAALAAGNSMVSQGAYLGESHPTLKSLTCACSTRRAKERFPACSLRLTG